MNRKKAAIILSLALLALAPACSKVPSGIIPPHEMARLMADVHTGEAVVDNYRRIFNTDSMRQAMKQSVYMKHGYTTAEVDSSLAWYGRHIKLYMDVYDETIEILEGRLIESGNRVAAANALSIAGDSVDVWPGARYIIFNDRKPSPFITFSFDRDPNWERGDHYTWRAHFFNTPQNTRWLIGSQYADGTVETISETISGDGWKEIKIQTDSLSDPVRIFGYLYSIPKPGADMKLDSLELVRKRISPETYLRPYSIVNRHFYEETEIENYADSTATE